MARFDRCPNCGNRLEAARAAAFLGDIAASNLSGTLLVTHRQEGRA
ncbi:MAG: hypothetical protein ABI553_01285 [Chloroflexota bacterium]